MAMGGADANLGIDSEIGVMLRVDAEIQSGLKIPPQVAKPKTGFCTAAPTYEGIYLHITLHTQQYTWLSWRGEVRRA